MNHIPETENEFVRKDEKYVRSTVGGETSIVRSEKKKTEF
jgi:hypothetical protein